MGKRVSALMVLVLMMVTMVSFAEGVEEPKGNFADDFDPKIYGEKLQ